MSKTPKEYTGSTYIGVVGPDTAPVTCQRSIERIIRRQGDSDILQTEATKGYEARQTHINKFINETNHSFIFLMDHDMIFPADTLERLRNHKLPYVSGLYMRRQFAPMGLVWYRPFTGQFPMEPWIGLPEKGRLHKIGASGWGCVLLHREVILAVRSLLHGEWEVLEDDMDVYPYDLGAIMRAISGLRLLVDEKPGLPTLRPALEAHTAALEQQIRPLRADHEPIGSDIRFPFFAKLAGYQLMGDPDVVCGHDIMYPLSVKDYEMVGDDYYTNQNKANKKNVRVERKRLKGQLEALTDDR